MHKEEQVSQIPQVDAFRTDVDEKEVGFESNGEEQSYLVVANLKEFSFLPVQPSAGSDLEVTLKLVIPNGNFLVKGQSVGVGYIFKTKENIRLLNERVGFSVTTPNGTDIRAHITTEIAVDGDKHTGGT